MSTASSLVFLDIDGVLNSEEFFRRARDADMERDLDRLAVARLNRICCEGPSQVVITSTWRLDMPLPVLVGLLQEHGFDGEVIGATPSVPGIRGGEISAWLRTHRGWRSYVILDDRDDMGRHGRRLVRTTMERGLLDEHVTLAHDMLAKRVWFRWL